MPLLERVSEWLFARRAIAAATTASAERPGAARRARAAALLAASDRFATPAVVARAQGDIAEALLHEAAREAIAARDESAPTPTFEEALSALGLPTGASPQLLERAIRATLADESGVAAISRLRTHARVRLGGVFALLVSVIVGGIFAAHGYRAWRDLARGKPWSTSSSAMTCEPARHRCGTASTDILFHTKEEDNPWFQVDLGAARRITKVEIRNRRDCCPDRAIPLVVETSLDGAQWIEVGRRTDSFFEWTAQFPPREARFVRARALRVTILHLRGLRVW